VASLRAALVGCGGIARRHVKNICVDKSVPGLDIVAFMDIDPQKARDLSRFAGGGDARGSIDDVLTDDRIDCVLIATDYPSHVTLCQKALSSGKHVFSEKPLGRNLKECLSLREVLGNNPGLTLLVGYCYRYHPVYLAVNQGIPSPSMTYAHVMGKKETPGIEYLYHNLCHTVDLICWLHGTDPVGVYAQAVSSCDRERPGDSLLLDRWIVNLKFENDSVACVGIGGEAEGGYLPKWYYKVTGRAGVTAEVVNNQDVYFRPDENRNLRNVDYFAGHVDEMKSFAAAIAGGPALPVTFRDALRANYIIELAQQSAREGASVPFDKGKIDG